MISLHSLVIYGLLLSLSNAVALGKRAAKCKNSDPLIKSIAHHKEGNLFCRWYLGIQPQNLASTSIFTPEAQTVTSTSTDTAYTTDVATATVTDLFTTTSTSYVRSTCYPTYNIEERGTNTLIERVIKPPYSIKQLSQYPAA